MNSEVVVLADDGICKLVMYFVKVRKRDASYQFGIFFVDVCQRTQNCIGANCFIKPALKLILVFA